MKGLLIKDLRLMLGQKTSLIMIAILGIMMFVIQENSYFAIGYMTMLGAVFSIGTVNYDAFENGMAYMMTLPIRRRDYVFEKYVFILASSLGLGIISIVLSILVGGASVSANIMAMLGAAAGVFFVAIIVISFMLPIQLIFGPEKSRLATLLLGGGIGVAIYFLGQFGASDDISTELLENVGEILVGKQTGFVATVILIVGILVILTVSMLISIKIIEKKEY